MGGKFFDGRKQEPVVKRVGRPANDPVASFWAKTVQVADDVYPDHVLWHRPLDGRQPYMSVENVDRNARQVAFKYIRNEAIEWGTLVAGCSVQCVDPRCLVIVPRTERPLKCWPCLRHERQEDWAIEINGKEFCRIGMIYWVICRGERTQMNWMLNEAKVHRDDRDRWEPILIAEFERYPEMVEVAAKERLANYVRDCKKRKAEPAEHSMERFRGIIADPSKLLEEWELPA